MIAIPLVVDGREIVRYFIDEDAADEATAAFRPRDARRLVGAWRRADPDFDWEEFADELDRNRHERAPTPIIELDDIFGVEE